MMLSYHTARPFWGFDVDRRRRRLAHGPAPWLPSVMREMEDVVDDVISPWFYEEPVYRPVLPSTMPLNPHHRALTAAAPGPAQAKATRRQSKDRSKDKDAHGAHVGDRGELDDEEAPAPTPRAGESQLVEQQRASWMPLWWPIEQLPQQLAPAVQGGQQMQLRVDVKEEEDRYVVRADIPGVGKEHIRVVAGKDGKSLELRTERRADAERDEERDGVKWHVTERSFGTVSRKLRLPKDAQGVQARAKYRDGVLEVTVPKLPKRSKEAQEPEEEGHVVSIDEEGPAQTESSSGQ